MNPTSVLIVDSSLIFQRILTRFLEQAPGVLVAGVAGGGEEALALAKTVRPDVVLLDLAASGLGGVEMIRRLRELLPGSGIIAMAFLEADDYRQAALAAGADGLIRKVNFEAELLPKIRAPLGTPPACAGDLSHAFDGQSPFATKR